LINQMPLIISLKNFIDFINCSSHNWIKIINNLCMLFFNFLFIMDLVFFWFNNQLMCKSSKNKGKKELF
jgi:hypothetical protein